LQCLSQPITSRSFPTRRSSDLEGELSDSPIVQSIGQLRETALRDRPDAMAARNALKAAERGVELAEAQRKRDVAVGIEYQRVGEDRKSTRLNSSHQINSYAVFC